MGLESPDNLYPRFDCEYGPIGFIETPEGQSHSRKPSVYYLPRDWVQVEW